MSRIYCGYNPPPAGFKTFFSEKYEDRLKRLPGFGKMRKSWDSHRRPTLIVLHVFADDFGALEKWMEMAYQAADPDDLGQLMDFYVDDVWAAYIFNEQEFSFFRSDEGCSVNAPPLIYGVAASGEVFFFGEFSGPKTPDVESLKGFCRQVIEGKVEEPISRKSQVEHIDLAQWNELIYASDEDVAVLFYNSLQNSTQANDAIMQSLSRLGDCLKQEAVRLYKMDIQRGSAPKKFSVETTPAFFFLKGVQKQNPIQCKYKLDPLTMLRFVAETASEELNYYNRHGHRRLHAELLAHMKEYFDLESNKQGYFIKLIDESYGDFELRTELFQFQAKRQTQEDGEKRSRKRKRKAGEEDTASSEDLQVNGYLKLLPKPLEPDATPPIARHWEDPYNLPQLHGANKSGQLQRFQCPDDTGRVYLIPDRACFYNHNVDQLPALLPQLLPAYDFIVMDPPWRNKYIRRLKRAKQELGYAMLHNDQLSLIPISQLTHPRSLVAIWCTNSAQHQTALEQQLLPSWHLRLLHKLRWYKLSSDHQLIAPPQADVTQKQPYEMLYVTCHADAPEQYAEEIRNTEMLLSVPSIVHSHKPPLLDWLREHLHPKKPNCLELFARYLQPHFTSVGLEVLKLMDERLYKTDKNEPKNI